jgi:hypothetical protein
MAERVLKTGVPVKFSTVSNTAGTFYTHWVLARVLEHMGEWSKIWVGDDHARIRSELLLPDDEGTPMTGAVRKPDNKELYKPENGCIIFRCRDWLMPADEKRLKSSPFIDLRLNVHRNPWETLHAIGVEAVDFKAACKIEDPYTGYLQYGAVPFALFTDAVARYRKKCHLLAHNYLDSDWLRRMYAGKLWDINMGNSEPSTSRLLMGTGYTEGTLSHDGSSERKVGMVPLEGGDSLGVWFWEWYNK